MSSDQPFTPSDEDVYGVWTRFQCFYADDGYGPRGTERAAAELDRYIARVRRDAAREALDGYAGSLDILVAPFRHLEGDRVRHWRDTHYPEETP